MIKIRNDTEGTCETVLDADFFFLIYIKRHCVQNCLVVLLFQKAWWQSEIISEICWCWTTKLSKGKPHMEKKKDKFKNKQLWCGNLLFSKSGSWLNTCKGFLPVPQQLRGQSTEEEDPSWQDSPCRLCSRCQQGCCTLSLSTPPGSGTASSGCPQWNACAKDKKSFTEQLKTA